MNYICLVAISLFAFIIGFNKTGSEAFAQTVPESFNFQPQFTDLGGTVWEKIQLPDSDFRVCQNGDTISSERGCIDYAFTEKNTQNLTDRDVISFCGVNGDILTGERCPENIPTVKYIDCYGIGILIPKFLCDGYDNSLATAVGPNGSVVCADGSFALNFDECLLEDQGVDCFGNGILNSPGTCPLYMSLTLKGDLEGQKWGHDFKLDSSETNCTWAVVNYCATLVKSCEEGKGSSVSCSVSGHSCEAVARKTCP